MPKAHVSDVPAIPGSNRLRARFVTLLARSKTPEAVQSLANIVAGMGDEMAALRQELKSPDGRIRVQAAGKMLECRVRAADVLVKVAALADARLEELLPTSSQQGGPQASMVVNVHSQGGRSRILMSDPKTGAKVAIESESEGQEGERLVTPPE